eukprot:TRINITY_DN10733_c0_g1_i2.p1 TRINITY_DN10733_c0_g1~~TRINITY_DN10733_c0_g1_i2.p1  ORF type:complete len:1533 (+),score=325.32 TRINITY_DN10733_c0_g1_i2:645-4601(+)
MPDRSGNFVEGTLCATSEKAAEQSSQQNDSDEEEDGFVPPSLTRESTIVLEQSALPGEVLPTDKDFVASPADSLDQVSNSHKSPSRPTSNAVAAASRPASSSTPSFSGSEPSRSSPPSSKASPTMSSNEVLPTKQASKSTTQKQRSPIRLRKNASRNANTEDQTTLETPQQPSSLQEARSAAHPSQRQNASKAATAERWSKPLLGLRPNQLHLYIDSVWSDWQSPNEPLTAGLTRVQLEAGEEALPPSNMNLLINSVQATEDQVRRLLISGGQTTDFKEMLKASAESEDKPLHLTVLYPRDTSLSSVKIWNYNQYNCEGTGAKQLRVAVNERGIFNGTLPKGPGSKSKDFAFTIPVTAASQADDSADLNRTIAQDEDLNTTVVPDQLAVQPDLQSNKRPDSTGSRRASPVRVTSATITTRPPGQASPTPPSQPRQGSRRSSRPLSRLGSPALWMSRSTSAQSQRAAPLPETRSHSARARGTSASSRASSPATWMTRRSQSDQALSKITDGHASVQARTSRPSSSRLLQAASQQAAADIVSLATHTPTAPQHSISQRPSRPSDSAQNATVTGRRAADRRAAVMAEDHFDKSMDSLALFKLKQSGRLDPTPPEPHSSAADDPLDKTITPEDAAIAQDEGHRPLFVDADSNVNARKPVHGILAELPEGCELKIVFLSTWGDEHYIGLTGIQCYDTDGYPLHKQARLTAEPLGLQMMAGMEHDPRVLDNLVDDVNQTNDVLHMWMAPFFGPGHTHSITMTFASTQKLAAVRLWNYNESRMYSYRGARHVEIWLDQQQVFVGELRQAPGHIRGDDADSFGELLLFSRDEEVLSKVAEAEPVFVELEQRWEQEQQLRQSKAMQKRPNTNDGLLQNQQACRDALAELEAAEQSEGSAYNTAENVVTDDDAIGGATQDLYGREIRLRLLETWGDPHYIGLTGLVLIDADGRPIQLEASMLDALPRDLNILPDVNDDDRTLDKLIDGDNATSQSCHMWLTPYTPGGEHWITIQLPNPRFLSGLFLWNYNKSATDVARGVRRMEVELDGRVISPTGGFNLRAAPGDDSYDFRQWLDFQAAATPASMSARSSVDMQAKSLTVSCHDHYEVPNQPRCLSVSIRILSTCGDHHYVGLNGLELITVKGNAIPLTPEDVEVNPHSINVLPGVSGDTRTPDKLIDGINETIDDRHMWLSPYAAGTVNTITILLHRPITLAGIRLWNYSKTPKRGVGDFQLLLDQHVVFEGSLEPSSATASAALSSPFQVETEDSSQVIAFDEEFGARYQSQLVGSMKGGTLMVMNDGALLEGSVYASRGRLEHRPTTTVAGRRF